MLQLVHNAYAEGDHQFKLWPTLLDRDSFRAAMRNTPAVAEFEDSLIVAAHEFFQLQIREWIASAPDGDESGRRVHGLETVLFALLQLVVIDLSAADDSTVIFETLNARGTPLLASDLVKNFVLQEARRAGLDADALHRDRWVGLENSWWRTDVRQGRILRPRLDVLLYHWLTLRTAEEVPSKDVFPRMRKYVSDGGIPLVGVVDDVVRIAGIFRELEEGTHPGTTAAFRYRWQIVDAGVATPLLLWLCSQPVDVLTPDGLQRCLRALESFLVRRTLCRLTTKDYNKLFLELLSRLGRAAPGSIEDALVAYLAGQESESRSWPDDRQLEAALLGLPLYRLLTRGRLRMVLEGVEDALRSPMAEEQHVARGALTIEHVMPRSWEKHWPLGDDPDGDAGAERSRLVHTIGNLTLINGKLNTAQSNGPWASKRVALGDHSVLHLNKQLLDAHGSGDWDEAVIRARSRDLARQVSSIWPGPAATR